MKWSLAMTMMFGLVITAMVIGLPVALSFLLANIVGTFVFLGGAAGLVTLPIETVHALANHSLIAIGLFIFMGELLFHTNVAFKAIDATDKLISRVPARLSIVSIVSGTIFSSLSGSTIANTALLGKILLPNMIKSGYDKRLAMGPIMAVGGIAMLVPPSALAVLLASLAEQSVSKLLLAAIVPGLMMAVAFVAYVVVLAKVRPHLAPAPENTKAVAREWKPFIIYVLPLLSVFAVIVCSIVFKIASPTESAALGVVTTVIACAAYRELTWSAIKKALIETVKINTMIMFIVAGSMTFSQIVAVSGVTSGLLEMLTNADHSPLALLALMLLVLLVLGAFVDQVSMMLLTLPIFIPIVFANQIDMTHFLVLMLIAMELSLLTPPFGLLLFVMKGVAPFKAPLTTIYRAALPFVIIEMFVMALLLLKPEIVLWIPRLLD